MAKISDPHGGRRLQEWIGATPDSIPPDYVRDRVLQRSGGRCHISGRNIRPGESWQLDHVKPLALGGRNRESNLAPALAEPHRVKSIAEIERKAKADRCRRKHNGTWPKPTGNARLQSRPFQKPRYQHERTL